MISYPKTIAFVLVCTKENTLELAYHKLPLRYPPRPRLPTNTLVHFSKWASIPVLPSSDKKFLVVSRRFFLFLHHSIDIGVVFLHLDGITSRSWCRTSRMFDQSIAKWCSDSFRLLFFDFATRLGIRRRTVGEEIEPEWIGWERGYKWLMSVDDAVWILTGICRSRVAVMSDSKEIKGVWKRRKSLMNIIREEVK